MKLSRKNAVRLQEMLKSAYHEKSKACLRDAGVEWETGVMQRIRSMDHAESLWDIIPMFNEFVWRLSPVCLLIIVLMGVFLVRFHTGSELEMMTMFMDDPMVFGLGGLFNIQTG